MYYNEMNNRNSTFLYKKLETIKHCCLQVMPLNEYVAFLSQKKPACLYSKRDKDDREYVISLLSMDYPHYDIYHLVLFFQNEQQKSQFVEQYQGIEFRSAEHHRLIGLTLGYPPLAVEHFVRSFKEGNFEDSVGIYYHGYTFSSHKEDVYAIANWLWTHIPTRLEPVKVTKSNGKSFWIYPKIMVK